MSLVYSSPKPGATGTPRTSPTTYTVQRERSTSSDSGTAIQQAQANVALDQPGIIEFSFGIVDIAANLTDSQLYRIIPFSTPAGAQLGAILPSRGSVIGLTFAANTNKTAGTATWRVFIGGTSTAATLVWSNGTASGQTLFAKGTYPFSAGSSVDVRLTTDGSFAPTTVDALVMLYCYMDPTTTV